MIRVLIVEDSPVIARILSSILNSTPDIEVIGIARDGERAITMTEKLRPDLITMDIKLPKLNGYEATKHIMAYAPTPILVVSSTSYTTEMNMTFNAIYFGALDMIEKGPLHENDSNEAFASILIEKVRLLSKVRVIHHPMAKLEKSGIKANSKEDFAKNELDVFIVGMAASTGGPQVIYTILNSLPKTFDFSVLIVQHIVPAFTEGFVEWLASGTERDIVLARSGEKPKPNRIYVAPGNYHLKISHGKMVLTDDPPYKGHKPSANYLFSSLAEHAGKKCMGVILTGMGADGLEGLTAMHKNKVPIIAQDEETSVVYGMPKVCLDAGIVTSVASRNKIADEIMHFFKTGV